MQVIPTISMRLILVSAIYFLGACSHPLQIEGQGDIKSASGNRDCTYEEFSSHSDPSSEACPNYVTGDYSETYTAHPKPGWEFDRWEGCGNTTEGPCSFSVEAAVVDKAWGRTAAPLIAHFKQQYTFERLGFNVHDAEYIATRDRLVALSDHGDVYLYDLDSRAVNRINLPKQGNCISVSPDGTRAAVGHNGFVSYVDLENYSLIREFEVEADVYDIVLAANGYAYTNPNMPDRTDYVFSINLATGSIDSSLASGGSNMALHPSGDRIYLAGYYESAIRLATVDIQGGKANVIRDSDTSAYVCNRIWISDDGTKLLTGCGNVFHADATSQLDLDHAGSLENLGSSPPNPYSGSLISLSQKEGEILHLDERQSDTLYFHRYPDLSSAGVRQLPKLIIEEQSYKIGGKFIFHTSSGGHVMIGAVEEESGLTQRDGILRETANDAQTNARPWAVIPERLYTPINEAITLNGSQSFDPEGEPLSYFWQLQSAPDGSTASISDTFSASPQLVPDRKGTYRVELLVNDGIHDSLPSTWIIEAEDPADDSMIELLFSVVDAEFSTALNSLIMLTNSPGRIVRYDLGNGSFSTVLLPANGNVIGLTQDGLRAAVGHNATESLSLVNLETGTVLGTYPTGVDFADLVLGGNGYAYMFPVDDSSGGYSSPIYSLNLLSGLVTQSHRKYFEEGTMLRLHPDGEQIYGATTALSPSNLEAFDITAGTAENAGGYVYTYPYHGEYEPHGNVWVASDGSHLFARSGRMYHALPGDDKDMHYAGGLGVTSRIRSLSNIGDEVAMVMSEPGYHDDVFDYSHHVLYFSYNSRRLLRELKLPTFGNGDQSKGILVFHDSASGTQIIIMQAVAEDELLDEFGLFIRRR